MTWIAGAACIALITVAALGLSQRTSGSDTENQSQSAPATTIYEPTDTQTTPSTTTEDTGYTDYEIETEPAAPPPRPTRAETPEQALKLRESDAFDQLYEMRGEGTASLNELSYSWVPQISSKCVGLPRVDIEGPDGFFPDGYAETRNPGNAEILAFHLGLDQKYNVVTALWRDVSPRTPNYPVCEDSDLMWHAFAEVTFDSGEGANQWCDDEGFPVDECFARYLVQRGQTGTKYLLRD